MAALYSLLLLGRVIQKDAPKGVAPATPPREKPSARPVPDPVETKGPDESVFQEATTDFPFDQEFDTSFDTEIGSSGARTPPEKEKPAPDNGGETPDDIFDDLEQIIVKMGQPTEESDGKRVPVLLRDVATVSWNLKDQENAVLLNGTACVGLSIYKEYLIWVGGISDYGVAVFKVELEKALEKIRKVNH